MIIDELKICLTERFKMKDLGPDKQILNIEIQRHRQKGELSLVQRSFGEGAQHVSH